jgi:hypothetical protein
MCIFDIINKLEIIKHKYLIYTLEKYTDQITNDDIKKKEEERKKQVEVAKEEIKKPVEDIKKPVEEIKKSDDSKNPAEEVKKFENNIMDSLKWVFISIGIFIFLIFVISLIYWFMYSGNNEQIINEPDNINKYVSPQPANQYLSPQPANQYLSPQPANQYVSPQPVNQYVSPQPANQYLSPKNIDNPKDSEESIFSSLFSRTDKPPEIISKTKLPADENINLLPRPISESQLISKAQADAETYLEKIANTDANKINEENNISKLILSPVRENNNINEYKKEISKI